MAQKKLKPAALILLLVVAAVTWWLENRKAEEPPADGALRQAIQGKRSGVWVEGEGRIVHLLPDDRIAPRHQLCLVELVGPKHTIKISHNVDLAPKVPWAKGDSLTFRGRFEWNDKGGVVHWTHHDPKGRQQGGWLKHRGKVYK